MTRVVVLLIATIGLVAPATAEDDLHREVLGVLLSSRVTVEIEDAPVRTVFARLADAIGLTIIGRYEDDRVGHGIDPDASITLRVEDALAIDVLEMILDRATLYQSCTWQIRTGFVEVGTKRRLSTSRRRQIYDVSDLLLEPPYFASGRGAPVDVAHYRRHPYRSASMRPLWADPFRLSTRGAAEELIRAFSEVIEPGNWDYELRAAPALGPDARDRMRLDPGAYRSDDRRVAQMRSWKTNALIVNAPDFFHRRIGGYGTPIAPDLDRARDRIEAGAADPSGETPAFRVALVGIDPPTRRRLSLMQDLAVLRDADAGGGVVQGRAMGEPFRLLTVDRLVNERVSVAYADVDVRAALDDLGARLGVPLVGRYADDRLGYGLDPVRRISVDLEDVPFLDALEAILHVATDADDPGTWQIRRGYLEVGPKSRLSVPAARDLRLHHVRDLIMHIPQNPMEKRKLPNGIALDLVETVVTTVEPEAWDWGQIDYYEDDGQTVTPVPAPRPTRPDGTPRPPRREPARYVEAERPAVIRHWRDVLIVNAPDYVHRQLDGEVGLPGKR
jgi:hypothetical protein